LVVAGYTVSSLVRPLVALVATWWQVFALRFIDRVGKGVRGAPRDAMLADLAPAALRGRVFGVHRAMDHAGAVAGPVLASIFLWLAPGAYRTLFLLTIVPGLLVVVLVRRVPRDDDRVRRFAAAAPRHAETREPLPGALWALFAVIGLFSVANSTDAYLLLRLSNAGVPTVAIPLLWAALHVVKSSGSVCGGLLADRVGKRRVITAGWLVYAAVYAGFASAGSAGMLVALFIVYGSYFGLTEGAEKALVADLVPASRRGFAFGVYNALVGVGALVASVVFGLVWEGVSQSAAFWLGAVLALAAAGLLRLVVPEAR
jgi:MFS family permease